MNSSSDVVTSIDLLQNFMSANRISRIEEASGLQLWELGVEVRRFAESYVPPTRESDSHPLYIGGWPSANFWNAAGAPLVSSTLLFAGQVYVKDPIIDWFSFSRYENEQLLGSRQGFLRDDMHPDMASTRAFLAAVVPAFLRLEPLIRSGAIVLVPGEATVAENKQAIEGLAANLATVSALDPREVCSRFSPDEVATDDTRRGMFAFAGGEKDAQLHRAIRRGLLYFSREYVIAQQSGIQYAAPWSFEQYVCDQGLMNPSLRSESQRVVQAIWTSELPIFSNLTPNLLRDIRKDESFAAFRAALFEAYRGISSDATEDELAQQVAEAEGALLKPHIKTAERSARTGLLSRLGIELTSFTAQMSNAFMLAALRGQVDASTPVQGATAYALGKLPKPGDTTARPIFAKLAKHHRKIGDEIEHAEYRTGINSAPVNPLVVGKSTPEGRGWNIDDEPSMTVRVSSGIALIESAKPSWEPIPGSGSEKDRNKPCSCGSGAKWKKCCLGVPQGQVRP